VRVGGRMSAPIVSILLSARSRNLPAPHTLYTHWSGAQLLMHTYIAGSSARAALPMLAAAPRHLAIKKRCARGIAAPAPQMHTVLTFCIKDFICISETKCLVIHKLHSISSTPLKSTFWSTSSQDPVCDCTPMVQTPRVSRCRCSTPSLAPESHKGVVPHTPTLPTRLRSRGLPNRLSP